MNKAQKKELEKINVYVDYGMLDTAARALSALIRCSVSESAKREMARIAEELEIKTHPDFIV